MANPLASTPVTCLGQLQTGLATLATWRAVTLAAMLCGIAEPPLAETLVDPNSLA